MLKKKRFWVAGVILFAAIGLLVYGQVKANTVYYYEVRELIAKGETAYGETVKVRGMVVDGSVVRQTDGAVMDFTVADAESGVELPVVYQGVVPDTFTEGLEVVAEGSLGSNGVFRAERIMPKCPSRYEATPPK